MSYEFCEISKNTFFTEHLWTTASVNAEEGSYRPKNTLSFLICPNLNDSQTFKSSSFKIFFSPVYVIDAICFDDCFLFQLEDVIFSKSLSLLLDFFDHHIVVFFETSVLKEVRLLHYLHNNSAMLILMLMLISKIQVSHTILICTWKTFVADFFMTKFFTLLISWLLHTLLYQSHKKQKEMLKEVESNVR